MRNTSTLLFAGLLTLTAGCATERNEQLEANKDLVRRFAETINAADWAAMGELLTEDFARYSQATAGPPVRSREQMIRLQESFLATAPDQRLTVHMLVAEDDKVAALATYSGTQTGPMGDLPATGRPMESQFLSIFRIEDGRIAELWVEWDNLAMLTQLGLFPPPPAEGS
jgi:steroid delta-isomerase-like uncharacterized protein